MAEIIAIANQKGGVGKTTSTLNLGAALKEMGHRVLLVDLDPQGSLTVSMGFIDPDETFDTTIYNVLMQIINDDVKALGDLPIVPNHEGLELIPSNIELSNVEISLLSNPTGGNTVLKDALRHTRNAYDYVMLDCPPYLGQLTINALTAATQVAIPMQADYLALKGLKSLTGMINQIQRRSNRNLKISGIFLTIADQRLTHAKDIIEVAKTQLGHDYRIFQTIIRDSATLKEAPVAGQSILAYDPTSYGAEDYRNLAKELVHG